MQNISIGKSGIEVPFLGMGTWAFGGGSWWGDNDDALSVKAIETAVEQGIVWIDTAPIYGLYHSEEVVGEALRHIDRDKVILSTKCGLEWRHESPVLHKVVDGVQTYRDLSAKSIIEDVEDSLRRLHTDHLDVLYTHWQSPDFGVYPLEETMEAIVRKVLQQFGKLPTELDREERIALIAQFDQHGAFRFKGMVEHIASIMGISKYTLYSYRKACRQGPANGPQDPELPS